MNIYDSIVDAVQELDAPTRGEIYTAVIEYLRYGMEPDLGSMSQIARVLFVSFKPNLDNQISAKERGKKGGRPRKEESKAKAEVLENDAETESKAKAEVSKNMPFEKSEQEQEQELEETTANAVAKKGAPEKFADERRMVVAHLNAVTGSHYRPDSTLARRHIDARLREGHTVEDCIHVIDAKAAQWLGDERMSAYLRPETLFGPKFEGYLAEWARAGPTAAPDRFDMYEILPDEEVA